jgi:secretion/DNA translocation related TadE-like protein
MKLHRRLIKLENGAGTILGVSLVAVIVVVLFMLGSLLFIEATKQDTQKAADLSALAGAQALGISGEDYCDIAKSVVEENGATFVSCSANDTEVTVTAQKTVFAYLGVLGVIEKSATAAENPNCG